MADLASKSTDGRISFTKYVTDNPRFLEVEYEVETGKVGVVYKKSGKSLTAGTKQHRAGTKLSITSPKLHEISGMRLAAVKVGTEVGFMPINVIRKPTTTGNGTQYEDEVVKAINKYIVKAGGTVNIRLKGSSKIYKGLSYAMKVDSKMKQAAGVKADPKADIIICRDKKSPFGPDTIYISHKKAGGPEAFQQYGGVSEQAGELIAQHKVVQKFLAKVASFVSDGMLQVPVMGKFDDSTLACLSIYGPEYGKKFSLQHTQLIGQGNPVFTASANFVELSFSSHMSLSGDLSHFVGGYLPVLGATARAGRGFYYKGKRYDGARIGIYPQKLIATRSGIVTFSIK